MKVEIELTKTEYRILRVIALDPAEFLQNFARVRVESAKKELLKVGALKYIEEGIQMPTGEDAIIDDMILRGWIKSAAARNQIGESNG